MSTNVGKPVAVNSYPTEVQASMAVNALANHGIHASMVGELTAMNRCEGPGWVRVFVQERDLEQAESVLREFANAEVEVDWSQVDFDEDVDV